MNYKINHLHFKTPDPDQTAQWYIEFMGAKIVQKMGEGGATRGYRLDLHGVPLNVTTLVEGQTLEQFYGLEHVAIDVDDYPAMVEMVKANGRKILEERTLGNGRRVCFFDGPEGVRLEVMEMATSS